MVSEKRKVEIIAVEEEGCKNLPLHAMVGVIAAAYPPSMFLVFTKVTRS